jgi:osomolarity two-component system response regulator SSK1
MNLTNILQPVNFVWLERKVMEWGCMQALIDFDGWRKWKDFSSNNSQPTSNHDDKSDKKAIASKKKKNRFSLGSSGGASSSTVKLAGEEAGGA